LFFPGPGVVSDWATLATADPTVFGLAPKAKKKSKKKSKKKTKMKTKKKTKPAKAKKVARKK
jgi:hypothetical protein